MRRGRPPCDRGGRHPGRGADGERRRRRGTRGAPSGIPRRAGSSCCAAAGTTAATASSSRAGSPTRAQALLLGRRDDVTGDARHHLQELRAGRSRPRHRGRRRRGLERRARADRGRRPGGGRRARHRPALRAERPRRARHRGDARAPRQRASRSWPWTCRRACRRTRELSTGAVAGATSTVTFAAPKHGHVLPPACDHGRRAGGRRHRHSAGERGSRRTVALPDRGRRRRPRLSTPGPERTQGDFGHVLVVAGSVGKTGAAVLAAGGAALGRGPRHGRDARAVPRDGGGGPRRDHDGAARSDGLGRPRSLRASALLALARERDAVVLGPGLGQDEATRRVRARASSASARCRS